MIKPFAEAAELIALIAGTFLRSAATGAGLTAGVIFALKYLWGAQ